jgi:exopolysaccharide biosynthesis polyprenyl glycosylphosphotransferase
MGGLTVLVDIVAVTLSYYAAYLMRLLLPWPTPIKLAPFGNYACQMAIYVFSVVLTFLFLRLYQLRRASSRIDLVYLVVAGVTIAALVATALSYLFFATDSDLTRGVFIYSWGFSSILLLLGRVLTGWLRQITRRHYPVLLLLVGTGDAARMILQKTLKSPHLGYRVVGFVGSGDDVVGLPVLGPVAQLGPIIRQQRAEEVVIALPEASHEELLDIIGICETERATVRVFPDLFQIIASDLTISDLDGLPLLTVRDVALRGWKLAAKRAMDLVVSGMGLIVVSPLFMFLALLVKLGSRGPVFYSQERVGLDGNPFPMLKFRSMRVDAERDTGPVWAVEDDPRRTPLGTFLRKTSIDELPQLINVLLGDMSLVGPRPERPVFVEQFRQVIPRYMERHKEKAGMTGWAQVNGLRGDTSIFERTKYDLYYIENWSLLFDIKIIIRTVTTLFRRERHAY